MIRLILGPKQGSNLFYLYLNYILTTSIIRSTNFSNKPKLGILNKSMNGKVKGKHCKVRGREWALLPASFLICWMGGSDKGEKFRKTNTELVGEFFR